MRLSKKNLNQLCIVTWKDAKGVQGDTLSSFLKEGWMVNKTVGWLKYYDKEKVITASEMSEGREELDMVWIPRGWITDVEWIEEG